MLSVRNSWSVCSFFKMIGERKNSLLPVVIPISGKNQMLDLAKRNCQSFFALFLGERTSRWHGNGGGCRQCRVSRLNFDEESCPSRLASRQSPNPADAIQHLANCSCNSEMAKTNSHGQFVAAATVKVVIWMAKDSKLRNLVLVYSFHRQEGKRYVDC